MCGKKTICSQANLIPDSIGVHWSHYVAECDLCILRKCQIIKTGTGSVLFSFLQTKRSLMSLSSEDINVRLQELGSRVHNTTAGAGKDLVSSLVSGQWTYSFPHQTHWFSLAVLGIHFSVPFLKKTLLRFDLFLIFLQQSQCGGFVLAVTMSYTRLKDHSTMPYICALSQTVNDSRVFLGRRWDGQRWWWQRK